MRRRLRERDDPAGARAEGGGLMTHRDDLDALVTELNAGIRPAAGDGEPPAERRADEVPELARLRAWLEEAMARSASDVLLVAGAPPSLRVDAVVHPLGSAFGGPLGSEEIEDTVLPALPPHARRMYREDGIA